MGNDQYRLFQAALRTQFSAFARRAFAELNPATTLKWNWHYDAICHALEKVMRGETRRLIITIPPRNLKSTLGSIAFPAYVLGQNPSAKLVCISYSSDLSEDFSRKTRILMKSPFYRDLFPKTMISPDRDSVADFMTTRKGHRIATSTHGTLTGRGGDIIIVDDLQKPEEAYSEQKRKSSLAWFDSTVPTRLDDPNAGAVIIIMQRLHMHDLVGHVVERGNWEVLDLPAIAETDRCIEVGSGQTYHRKAGELLQPERDDEASLTRRRQEIGSDAFFAQYQQQPVPPDGAIFKLGCFQRYREIPVLDDKDLIVQSWDTALSESATADYSVCTTWVVRDGNFYLYDVYRDRLSYPDLKRKVIELALSEPVDNILIEDAGSGKSLLQDLRKERPKGLPTTISVKVSEDKVVRAAQQSATVEGGRVLLPHDAPWLDDFLKEVREFPQSRHDDQIDSMTQMLNWHIHERIEYAKEIKVSFGN